MIHPDKLSRIPPGQRRRKLALCFGALERDINGVAEAGCGYDIASMERDDYIKTLMRIALEDPAIDPAGKLEIESALGAAPFSAIKACNCTRHQLLRAIGTFPAEWDLIIAPHSQSAQPGRRFFEGTAAYAEDIRSPFNLGSVFRTAEALGLERLYISPFCSPPEHPRAKRSAMGCTDTLPWERLPLDELPEEMPVFALETGGTPIDEFEFPPKGIVIIGSEELGTSPEALKRAEWGRVSIPMPGMKASLNVGVAFGILVQRWMSFLEKGLP
ncbi:MAG: TrmH family RNA methyltransferase [Spirochaetaceae bacterium]|jgi:TrmH family RNA methyltransferase|nr:TrmH family RNA methyltransferase [Spirochaetaceae bacterium]